MPADLRPKPKPRKICITTEEIFIIAFIIFFILAIVFVLGGRASYYYNFPLQDGDNDVLD